MKKSNSIYILMILLSGMFRLIPHPWNFTPIMAICILSGYKIKPISLSITLPILTIFMGDLIIGMYEGIGWVYLSYILIVGCGLFMKKKHSFTTKTLIIITGPSIFFLVSNFGVWVGSNMYPITINGLFSCYIAAIPFFKNTLAGTLFYTGIFLVFTKYYEYKTFKIIRTKR